jgi:epithelial splicing regulatory protein 1/2
MSLSSSGSSTSHLVCLFLVTSGQNEENLGIDEEQIAVIVYLLYDIANNRVVTLQQHYVRPTADDISETKLTEDCKAQTGLCEDDFKNAQSLEHVLDDLDRFLRAKEIHPEHGGKPFCFCTDGPLHLRQCLHPEAFRKKLNLPSHYYRYFDIRQCFRNCYMKGSNDQTSAAAMVCGSLKEMLNFLGLEADQSVEYGVRHCQDMSKIIHRLITDGYRFMEPVTIMEKLESGMCYSSDHIDDETIVKARGLPWQSSDQDIANFFRGLNIARGGVALCLSQQGRRNGEALVRLEDREQRALALRRHKHHLGQRYIEVYRATGKDFVNIAGGSSREAQMFLSRHSNDGSQVIVRMRGLPYTCTAEQVIKFFKQGTPSVEILDGENGILFVHQADGRATGDAFVLFTSEDQATKALTKHKQSIGTRYIELFKSTTAEVLQVLNRSLDPRTPSLDSRGANELALLTLPTLTLPVPQQVITSGKQRDCIRLRGLPYEASVNDIVTFLGDHSRDIVSQGVHLIYNAEGTPSGEAFIQMDSEASAESASMSKNKKLMFVGSKRRYVDVIQCSGDEMSVVLQQGLPAPFVGLPQSTAVMPQPAFWPLAPPPFMQPIDFSSLVQQRPNNLALAAAASPGCTPNVLNQFVATASPGGNTYNPSNFITVANGGQLPQQLFAAPTSQPTGVLGGLPPHLVALPQAPLHPQATPMTVGTAPAGFQPIMYWYPSPPMSPQNAAYFVQACPTAVPTKGLTYSSQPNEMLTVFDGMYEPDAQLQRRADGRPTGETFLTFGSRADAERAIAEHNRKQLGNSGTATGGHVELRLSV